MQTGIRDGKSLTYDGLFPLEAKAAGQAAFIYGMEKYSTPENGFIGARNWERGLPWQSMIESLKRHIDDFERGKDFDDGEGGSGLPQICHIMSSASMLCASVLRGIGEDNRNKEDAGTRGLYAKECSEWIRDRLDEAKTYREEIAEVNTLNGQ